MYVKALTLRNFRNRADLCVEFCAGLNVLSGENAAGKTNIAEAVFLTCIPRSFRTENDSDLVLFGAKEAYVKTEIMRRDGLNTVEITIPRRGKKKILINGTPALKAGDLMGVLNAVFFSPEEIGVVRAAPSERRRFMDVAISQNDKSYFYALNRYNKILRQRNELLKSGASQEEIKDFLPAWDGQLCASGAEIFIKRREFIKELNAVSPEIHKRLTDGKEDFTVGYHTTLTGSDKKEAERNFLDALTADTERDIRTGATGRGAHRDDLQILAGGADMRSFGSCGQQRTAAITLKLAELARIESLAGEPPVLILDDVLSELDLARERRLLAEITCQTILTTARADLPEIKGEVKVFKVRKER